MPVLQDGTRVIINRYPGTCIRCNQEVGAEQGQAVRPPGGRWHVQHSAGGCPTTEVNAEATTPQAAAPASQPPQPARQSDGQSSGVDLRTLPTPSRNTLYVAVRGEGDHIYYFKIRSYCAPGRGPERTILYVDRISGSLPRGQAIGSQRPGEMYVGRNVEQLRQIVEDPQAALSLYGTTIGRCGHCRRLLTDAESRARGIGPVCYGRTHNNPWSNNFLTEEQQTALRGERAQYAAQVEYGTESRQPTRPGRISLDQMAAQVQRAREEHSERPRAAQCQYVVGAMGRCQERVWTNNGPWCEYHFHRENRYCAAATCRNRPANDTTPWCSVHGSMLGRNVRQGTSAEQVSEPQQGQLALDELGMGEIR